MAKYIKLRDAIEDHLDPYFRFVRCRTCGTVLERYYFSETGGIKSQQNCHGGHFKSRGSGGNSGIYFDERACAVQCSTCNAFEQGKPKEFKEYLIGKYGEEVVKKLELKHIVNSYTNEEIATLGILYKGLYENLLKKLNLRQ